MAGAFGSFVSRAGGRLGRRGICLRVAVRTGLDRHLFQDVLEDCVALVSDFGGPSAADRVAELLDGLAECPAAVGEDDSFCAAVFGIWLECDVALGLEFPQDVVVGSPLGPLTGPAAAKGFCEFLTAQVTTERMDVSHAWYGDDFCVTEHRGTGTVPGQFLGIAGHGRRISFRLLHVWEFKTGRISRENVWLDSAAIVAQLTA